MLQQLLTTDLPSTLDNLWKKHFAGSKELANDTHAVHQRTLNHIERSCILEDRNYV